VCSPGCSNLEEPWEKEEPTKKKTSKGGHKNPAGAMGKRQMVITKKLWGEGGDQKGGRPCRRRVDRKLPFLGLLKKITQAVWGKSKKGDKQGCQDIDSHKFGREGRHVDFKNCENNLS